MPGQTMQFFQGLFQWDAAFGAERFFLCFLGLRGPPVYGTLADVAIGLAIWVYTGIVETIAVFRGALEGIKGLGSDGQDASIHTSAAGFYVDHDVHWDILTQFSRQV